MPKRPQNSNHNTENSQKVNVLTNVPQSSSSNVTQIVENEASVDISPNQVHVNCSTNNENILLRTALVQIEFRGERFTVRALIDPGSQRTFIAEKVRSRLQLPYQKSHFEIVDIGGQIQSASKEYLTKLLPTCSFEIPHSKEFEELDLADPTFNKSSQIDIILGNDYEHFINIDGIKKNICGLTSAYNTIFGWVLSGPIKTQTIQSFTTSVVISKTSDLNALLKKFWEEEEIPSSRPQLPEDEICENLYAQTTTRDESGRYMVRLPFKKEFPEKIFLGSSRFVALAQYSRMEKTLSKDPQLQCQYNAVLNEYLALNHMEETSSYEVISQGKYGLYYLPHHAVVRPEHKTTKVRVVFNASRKTKSQYSLNDVLYTGPTLQNDLITIILNWRKYKYVFSGDIQKMYRQILVHPDDRPFQRILFQNKPESPVKDYQLKTVTFGVNCAPYLAIRTLLQLASDSEPKFPKAASVLRTEAYVDDILSGGYSVEETISAQKEIINVLKSAGLPLKKITANDPKLLSDIPKEDLYDVDFLRFQESSSTKTLGIKWNAILDTFTYSFSQIEQPKKITKRQILSSVAKLFDPAGWLSPIIIKAKILMQQLWLEGLEWDDDISEESLKKWNELVSDLAKIESISIPRWLQYMPSDTVQIHGFCDASKVAYCATVYIRCQTKTHNNRSNLLLAKSKVAPIQTVCLPRLELNGAVLLANLVKYVQTYLNFSDTEVFLWTDSSIVLSWLSKTPSSWETYVANRIAQIHRLVPKANWRLVPTHHNPADLGTRGCKSHELVNHTQWWHGPSWLHQPVSEWPTRNPLKTAEKSSQIQTLLTAVQEEDILNRFSSYIKSEFEKIFQQFSRDFELATQKRVYVTMMVRATTGYDSQVREIYNRVFRGLPVCDEWVHVANLPSEQDDEFEQFDLPHKFPMMKEF
ncbi:uncharacterized protein LOC124420599 [Lucilia cuprina]|uniref:uncharacterized protein LOC124420599 n=1 Tax=Lucilia cuprina TaxID=7375 RepID=UPI001F06A631|nr:uncharacterized protein LOC124420599 [Lucilia cuprina]